MKPVLIRHWGIYILCVCVSVCESLVVTNSRLCVCVESVHWDSLVSLEKKAEAGTETEPQTEGQQQVTGSTGSTSGFLTVSVTSSAAAVVAGLRPGSGENKSHPQQPPWSWRRRRERSHLEIKHVSTELTASL